MECWSEANSDTSFVDRNAGLNLSPIIPEDWIATIFRSQVERSKEDAELLAASDQLIEELEQANLIFIMAPIYNDGMPAALKA